MLADLQPLTAQESILRLAVAALFGGAIGLERETHSQPAGLRTHMVVAVGAALMMLVSFHMATISPGSDPGRIAAQVVTGIGFLGAGAIFRMGMTVKGLTTSACLWTAAGIGLAVGAGMVKEGLAATLIVLITIFVFDKVEKLFIVGRQYRRFQIQAKDSLTVVGRIEAFLKELGIEVKQVGIQKDVLEGKIAVSITATIPDTIEVDSVVSKLSGVEDVERVEVE